MHETIKNYQISPFAATETYISKISRRLAKSQRPNFILQKFGEGNLMDITIKKLVENIQTITLALVL